MGCEGCGGSLLLVRAGSRFCSTRCRVAWHRRARRLPDELTSRRAWVRADGKRPIQVDGRPASSTDSRTWTSFDEVSASSAGDGFGIMLGSGLGCYDLDHTSIEDARVFATSVPERVVFAERSMSGNGVHLFVEAEERRGTKRPGFEFYSRARFIRVTGDRVLI